MLCPLLVCVLFGLLSEATGDREMQELEKKYPFAWTYRTNLNIPNYEPGAIHALQKSWDENMEKSYNNFQRRAKKADEILEEWRAFLKMQNAHLYNKVAREVNKNIVLVRLFKQKYLLCCTRKGIKISSSNKRSKSSWSKLLKKLKKKVKAVVGAVVHRTNRKKKITKKFHFNMKGFKKHMKKKGKKIPRRKKVKVRRKKRRRRRRRKKKKIMLRTGKRRRKRKAPPKKSDSPVQCEPSSKTLIERCSKLKCTGYETKHAGFTSRKAVIDSAMLATVNGTKLVKEGQALRFTELIHAPVPAPLEQATHYYIAPFDGFYQVNLWIHHHGKAYNRFFVCQQKPKQKTASLCQSNSFDIVPNNQNKKQGARSLTYFVQLTHGEKVYVQEFKGNHTEDIYTTGSRQNGTYCDRKNDKWTLFSYFDVHGLSFHESEEKVGGTSKAVRL